jgi:hypothetical protein
MRARSAIGVFGDLGLETKVVRRTPTALIPRWVSRQWFWHTVGQCNAFASRYGFLGYVFIKLHSLSVDAVIILANGHVQRSINLSASHVHLHLYKMLWLGFFDTLLFHIVKRLGAMGFKFGYVFGLGSAWHT